MVRLIVAIILIGMLAAGCDSYGSEEYPQIIIENLTLTSGGSSNSTGSSLWENATDNRYIKPKQDHSLNVTVTDTWPPVAPYVATFEHKGDGKGVSVRTLGGNALELYATTGYGLLINAQDVAFYSIGDVANSPSGLFVNTDTGSAFQAERNVIGTGDDKPIGIFKQREEQNNGSGVAIHNINKTGAVMQWGEPIESYNNAEWLYWMMPRLDNDYYIRMPNDIGQVNECWGINNINGRILNTSWLNCGGGSYTFNVSNNVTTEEVFNGNTVTLAGGNNLTVTQTGTDFIFDWTGILAPTLWTIYSGIDNFLRPFKYGYAVITSWGAVPDGNAWHDLGSAGLISQITTNSSLVHSYDDIYADDSHNWRGNTATVLYQWASSVGIPFDPSFMFLIQENMQATRQNDQEGYIPSKSKQTEFYQYDEKVAQSFGMDLIPSQLSILYPYIQIKRYAITFTRPYEFGTIPSILCTCGINGDAYGWMGQGGSLSCTVENPTNTGFIGICQQIDPADPFGERILLVGDVFYNWQSIGSEDTGLIQQGRQIEYIEETY